MTDPAMQERGPEKHTPEQEQSASEATPHDRRRRRRILIAVGVVLALLGALVAAALVGESIARQQGSLLIATEVREVFGLDEDHPVEVEFVGFSVLAQVAGGELDGVTVGVPGLPVGELRGDLEIFASGVPLDLEQPTERLQAVYRVAEGDLAGLSGFLAGTVVNDIALDDRLIRFGTGFDLFGVSFELAVGVEPAVRDGRLAFTPRSIEFNGQSIDVAALRSQFGGIVDPLLESRDFCVAELLPAALTLTAVQVGDEQLVIVLDAEETALGGPGFSELGTCG
ncbi:MAG: DUF2993 domain-containing protein [Microcella sp.]|uniref:LmeA family phospholipid-binding protein n=1 Tax=Microcella sp. TaxID=1913979 RepID=UPI00331497C4